MNGVIIYSVIAAVIAYFIGSINFSIILSRLIGGKDIRESGSGNAGATNMLRTHGKKMGALTLVLDILKGVACVLLARLAAARLDISFLPYIAGVCVILGHNFPIYFGFRGGKGVATSLGVVLTLEPVIGIIVGVFAIAVMAVTRYVSLGSILGGVAYVIAEVIRMAVGEFNAAELVCAVIIGALLVIRHHANIKRLLSGTENKLGGNSKAKSKS